MILDTIAYQINSTKILVSNFKSSDHDRAVAVALAAMSKELALVLWEVRAVQQSSPSS